MRHILARLCAVAVLLSLASCGGDGPDFIWLRVVHTIPDAPTVRVSYDEYALRQTTSYGIASNEGGDSLLSRSGPLAGMTAEYFGPDNLVAGTLLTMDIPVEKDHVSTVVLAGSFDAPQAFTVKSPRRDRPLATLHFQFAHAAPDQGALDVYVTDPETDLSATAPLATVEPLGHSDSIEVPFGATRIRLTRAGTLDLVMDSGERQFGEQEGARGPGNEWLFTIAPSIAFGDSPVFLIASSGRSSDAVRDADTPATVRAIHALPDPPEVDFYATTEPEQRLFEGLAFRSRSPLVATPIGDYTFAFRPAGDDGEPLAFQAVSLQRGQQRLAVLIGPDDAPQVLVSDGTPRSVATEARLRLANFALGSNFFSLYLSETEEDPLDPGNLVLRDLRFGQVSGVAARVPGEYYLTLTERFYDAPAEAAGAEETIFFGPEPIELLGGDIFFFALFPPDEEGLPEVLVRFDNRLP
jgi:hypothetical protein